MRARATFAPLLGCFTVTYVTDKGVDNLSNAIRDTETMQHTGENDMTDTTTQAETIAAMEQWALDNYDKGADTMAECWGASDYAKLITDCGSAAKAWAALRDIAEVYAERQADARNSAF
jgi:hypothetical protein